MVLNYFLVGCPCMLLHRMALVSFRLFCKNLCNLQEFFGQMVYRPPSPKIARTPMCTEYLKGQIPGIFQLEDIRLLFPTKTDIVSCDKMTISNQNKAWNRETSRRTVTTYRAIRLPFWNTTNSFLQGQRREILPRFKIEALRKSRYIFKLILCD